MIIRKVVTNVGIKDWDYYSWNDDMITMFVKRILRRTKSRRIVSVDVIIPEEEDRRWSNYSKPECISFNLEVGKKIKMSAKKRASLLRPMLEEQSNILVIREL